MQKLQQRIDWIVTAISSILLSLMMIILVYNVTMRFAFVGGGVQWYMESSQYLNIWAMFIVGIGLCATSDHLRITIIEEMQTGWFKIANKIIVELLTFIFYILLAYGTFLLASKSRQQIATMPPLKMAYVYWLLPITSVLSAISTIISLIAELTSKDKGGA